jgi:hypothetical protein
LDPDALEFAPNTRLGMALSELNGKRIYRKFASSKNFKIYEKFLLAELLGCRSGGPGNQLLRRQIKRQLTQENAVIGKRLKLRPDETKEERYQMAEWSFVRELAQIKSIAMRAGADMSDWSMSLGPGSLAFFDGILGGFNDAKSYYLKENFIFGMLAHLSEREPAFRSSFNVYKAYGDLHPFGQRLEIDRARESCPLLTSGGVALD